MRAKMVFLRIFGLMKVISLLENKFGLEKVKNFKEGASRGASPARFEAVSLKKLSSRELKKHP